MLDKILQYSAPGFYGNKVASIGDAVRKYADAKRANNGGDEASDARRNAEELCSSLMAESGFSDKGTAFIAVDREFFTPEGALDEKRLERFQKEIVKHYTSEQLKWSFAGTTAGFTQITKNAVEKQGKRFDDLLPGRLRDEAAAKRSKKMRSKNTAGYTAYIYQDGSVSESVLPSRMKVRFDVCGDSSGFDWKRGYSPDNKVDKREWVSGFNKEGVWEKVNTAPGAGADREISRIVTQTAGESGGAADDSLRVMLFDSEAVVMDTLSRLYKLAPETFYSISGELYGGRTVDREKTIERVNRYLASHGVKRIKAIVVSDTKKDTIDYYRKAFAGLVDGNTGFSAPSDEGLSSSLESLAKTAREKSVTNAVLERFFSLSEKGVKGEALYEGFDPETSEKFEEVPLNIFKSKEDLDTFYANPDVADALEPEVAAYIKGLSVPEDKQAALSNAVQTIARNYKELFRHTPVRQIDVVRAADEIVVRNRAKASIDETKLVTEKSFAELVNEGAGLAKGRKADVFFFHGKKSIKETGTDAGAGEAVPVIERGFPKETIDALEAERANVKLPEDARPGFERAFSAVLRNIKEVVESTGMRPAEIVSGITTVLLGKQGGSDVGKKRVFFEKNLRDFILEASEKNLYPVRKEKKGRSESGGMAILWKPFDGRVDFSDNDDLDSFGNSPFLEESGFDTDESTAIMDFIRSTVSDVPDKSGYSRGLLNLLRGYDRMVKPRGIAIREALHAYGSLFGRKGTGGGESRVADIVRDVAGIVTSGREARPNADKAEIIMHDELDGSILETVLAQDIGTILADERIASLRIPKEESAAVFDYLKSLKIPKEKRGIVNDNVATVLRHYSAVFAAKKVKAMDAVASAVYASGVKKKASQGDRRASELVESILGQDNTASGTRKTWKNAAGAGHEPYESIVSEEGFKRFVKSEEFVRSGLDADKFRELVTRYAKAYEKMEAMVPADPVPFVYANNPGTVTIGETEKSEMPLFADEQADYSAFAIAGDAANNVYNIGYVVKGRERSRRTVAYARQGAHSVKTGGAKGKGIEQIPGKGLSHIVTKENRASDTAGDFIGETVEREAVVIDFPGNQPLDYIDGTGQNASEESFPYLLANSAPGAKRASTPIRGNTRESVPFTQTSREIDTRTADNPIQPDNGRFRKMEENYNKDKRMLARSANANPLTGGSQTDGKSGSEEGNVVQQLSDDLLDELKKKTLDEGF